MGAGAASSNEGTGFEVHLDVFSGPFELLLRLIGKHQLDVTEVALAQVTDEFVAWIRSHGGDFDLDEASEFVLVAATLLDLKTARLLPGADVEEADDLALLEARDLLFARLLQYRAFKDVAATFAARFAETARSTARRAPLEPQVAALLPELVTAITPDQLAELAARALTPRPEPVVGTSHLHVTPVSVAEQATLLAERLRRDGPSTFAALVADARGERGGTMVVVARFLAVLELFRDGSVALQQADPMGELTVRWTGGDGDVTIVDDWET